MQLIDGAMNLLAANIWLIENAQHVVDVTWPVAVKARQKFPLNNTTDSDIQDCA